MLQYLSPFRILGYIRYVSAPKGLIRPKIFITRWLAALYHVISHFQPHCPAVSFFFFFFLSPPSHICIFGWWVLACIPHPEQVSLVIPKRQILRLTQHFLFQRPAAENLETESVDDIERGVAEKVQFRILSPENRLVVWHQDKKCSVVGVGEHQAPRSV